MVEKDSVNMDEAIEKMNKGKSEGLPTALDEKPVEEKPAEEKPAEETEKKLEIGQYGVMYTINGVGYGFTQDATSLEEAKAIVGERLAKDGHIFEFVD